MKINVKAAALTFGIFWGIIIIWAILMKLSGVGSTPFDFFDHFYLGCLSLFTGGFILGPVIGIVDGVIFGALFALLYNKLATDR